MCTSATYPSKMLQEYEFSDAQGRRWYMVRKEHEQPVSGRKYGYIEIHNQAVHESGVDTPYSMTPNFAKGITNLMDHHFGFIDAVEDCLVNEGHKVYLLVRGMRAPYYHRVIVFDTVSGYPMATDVVGGSRYAGVQPEAKLEIVEGILRVNWKEGQHSVVIAC